MTINSDIVISKKANKLQEFLSLQTVYFIKTYWYIFYWIAEWLSYWAYGSSHVITKTLAILPKYLLISQAYVLQFQTYVFYQENVLLNFWTYLDTFFFPTVDLFYISTIKILFTIIPKIFCYCFWFIYYCYHIKNM